MNDNDRAEREAGNNANSDGANSIAYQGEEGANSHVACLQRFPDLQPVPCATFEDALHAVKSGQAKYAMIPIENTLAGRVADVHHLLPHAGLYIVGEHFLPIRFQRTFSSRSAFASQDQYLINARPLIAERSTNFQNLLSYERSRLSPMTK